MARNTALLRSALRAARRALGSESASTAWPHAGAAAALWPSQLTALATSSSRLQQQQQSEQLQGVLGSVARRAYASAASDGTSSPAGQQQQQPGDAQDPALPAGALGRIEPRLAMVYTCTRCDTRSVKTFSRRSYAHGVVMVRCPGCQKMHLVADHLGWFGDKGWTIEDLARDSGTSVKVIKDLPPGGAAPSGDGSSAAGALALTVEDMAGWSRVEHLLAAASKHRDDAAAAEGQQQEGGPGTPAGDAGTLPAGADEVWEVGPEDLERWRRVRDGAKP